MSAEPYFAERGAVHHRDMTGFLFTVTPASCAEEVAWALNVAAKVDGARAEFIRAQAARREAAKKGVGSPRIALAQSERSAQ